MHHIKMYERPIDGGDFPHVVIPGSISIVCGIVGGLGMLPPFMLWGLVLFLVSAFVFVLNVVLYKTHENRTLNRDQLWLLHKYRELPLELRKQITLSHDAVKSMSKTEAGDAYAQLDVMHADYNELQTERNRYSGPAYVFNQRVKEVSQDTKMQLESARKVNSQVEGE